MQPARFLDDTLSELCDEAHYLFTPADLKSLLPRMSDSAFGSLLSRTVQSGTLERLCRGLYLRTQDAPNDGLLLFRAAARLRAACFNYISLETALSDAGVISQVLPNRITLMSSGRSNEIECGRWGVIEFVHTRQRPNQIAGERSYDARCGLWRASVDLALRDMRATRRDTGLVNWSDDELV